MGLPEVFTGRGALGGGGGGGGGGRIDGPDGGVAGTGVGNVTGVVASGDTTVGFGFGLARTGL